MGDGATESEDKATKTGDIMERALLDSATSCKLVASCSASGTECAIRTPVVKGFQARKQRLASPFEETMERGLWHLMASQVAGAELDVGVTRLAWPPRFWPGGSIAF